MQTMGMARGGGGFRTRRQARRGTGATNLRALPPPTLEVRVAGAHLQSTERHRQAPSSQHWRGRYWDRE